MVTPPASPKLWEGRPVGSFSSTIISQAKSPQTVGSQPADVFAARFCLRGFRFRKAMRGKVTAGVDAAPHCCSDAVPGLSVSPGRDLPAVQYGAMRGWLSGRYDPRPDVPGGRSTFLDDRANKGSGKAVADTSAINFASPQTRNLFRKLNPPQGMILRRVVTVRHRPVA